MEHIDIKSISNRNVGKEYYIIALIKNIRQTTGPTVFELRDNTGMVKATAFSKAESEKNLPFFAFQ